MKYFGSPGVRFITLLQLTKGYHLFALQQAKVFVRRLLSTVGTIRIGYTTQKYVGSNAATENSDFTPVTSTFDMIDGQATRTIEIDTIEDSAGQAEKDELFYVVLTSLQVVAGKLSGKLFFY